MALAFYSLLIKLTAFIAYQIRISMSFRDPEVQFLPASGQPPFTPNMLSKLNSVRTITRVRWET